MLHDEGHATDECRTLKEQAERMKEMYKNTFPAERSRKKRERQEQDKKEKERNS